MPTIERPLALRLDALERALPLGDGGASLSPAAMELRVGVPAPEPLDPERGSPGGVFLTPADVEGRSLDMDAVLQPYSVSASSSSCALMPSGMGPLGAEALR